MALTPTLPGPAYTSADVFGVERERLWAAQWCVVARTEDVLAGGYLRVEVAGESLLLVGADDGPLRAFANLCRHRGAELVDTCHGPTSGELPGGVIQCPYHQWAYGLDGRLRRTPHLTVGPDEMADLALHEIAVDTWGGFVFVHLGADDATRAPLRDQLGAVPERLIRYPLAELRRGHQLRYDVAANWKAIAENYNECYHCGPVHPELCDLVPTFRRGGTDLDWSDGIPHREGAWTFTASGTSDRAPFPDLDAAEQVRHKGELVYPNLLLSLAAEHVASFVLQPLAADHTLVTCDLLFHPRELTRPTFDPSDAADFWDLVNRQDWAICESVQRGMSSRWFTAGHFAPMEDDSLDIARWYTRYMR